MGTKSDELISHISRTHSAMANLQSKPKANSSPARLSRWGVGTPRFWRRLRLWEKKRGHRTTGSTRLAAAGETLFFLALSIAGVVTLAQLFVLRFAWHSENWLTTNVGLCLSFLLLVPLSVVSAYKAIYHALTAGNSAERIAALTNRAKNSELLADVRALGTTTLPTIPCDANLTNSPGIRLPFRLPSATSSSWRLAIVAGFCLLWNSAVAVLAIWAFQSANFHLMDLFTGSWWTLFRIVVLVYLTIGILATRYLFELLAKTAAIGPTSLEVSALPMRLGNEYRVFLSQSGHLHIDWLELKLVCDEEVSFTDGTDTRSESRRVFESEVFRHDNFEILPSEPFHCECPLDVPCDGMHSFVSGHNAVTWKLVVRLQPKGQQTKASEQQASRADNVEGKLVERDDSEVAQEKETTPKQRKAKTKRRGMRWMRTLMARFRRRRGKPEWNSVQRVFPLVVHPKS